MKNFSFSTHHNFESFSMNDAQDTFWSSEKFINKKIVFIDDSYN